MTTSPLFEFHITFDDIDDADALMRHLEAALPGRPVQVDIRGGDTRTVFVSIAPPPKGPERHPFRLVHPDFDTSGWTIGPFPTTPPPGFSPDEVVCCDAPMTRFAGPGRSRGWSCADCGSEVVEVTEDGEHIASAGAADLHVDADAGEISERDLVDVSDPDFDPSGWTVVGPVDPVGATASQERPPWSIGDRDAFSAMPIKSLNTDGWSPVDLLELLVFKLARAVPSFPVPETVVDDVAFAEAWAQAWEQFEGMPTKRIVIAALDLLTEPNSYDLAAITPLVDELVPRFEASIQAAPDLKVTVDVEAPAEDDHDGHTIVLGPSHVVDDPEPDTTAPEADETDDPDRDESESEDADGAGDAGIREDPEGTIGALATSPAPPATFNAAPGALTDQVVELLEAYPHVVFRAAEVDDALGIGDPQIAATKLGNMARAGRIRRLGRGQYQALANAATMLREQITTWLTEHHTGAATTIAADLDSTESLVKLELARMTEAGITRIGGRGWILCSADDTAERHKARRRAAVEAM